MADSYYTVIDVETQTKKKIKLTDNGDGTFSASSSGGGATPDTKTATIANGAALSGEIDLGSRTLVGVMMPAGWTAANLTFQASNASGGTFQDVYDSAGNELVTIASASKVIVDLPELAPLRFLKIRSGTTGTPVNQGADRTLTLILK